jgi:hypothetical protein
MVVLVAVTGIVAEAAEGVDNFLVREGIAGFASVRVMF